MRKFTSHKLIEVTDNCVKDGTFRVCDFKIEPAGIFLYLKIYCGKEHNKHRDIKICLTDFIFQIYKKLSVEQRKNLIAQINATVSE